METEIRNFIKIWAVAFASACYTFSLSRILHIPKGLLRLFLISPVIYLFIVLPYSLSSFHLGGPTIFYLVWLGTFKLLLFSFDLGPLSSQQPNISLPHFIAISLLPIKVNHATQQEVSNKGKVNLGRCVLFAVKLVAFALVIKVYDYKPFLPQYILLLNYCCHLYLGVEVILAVTAALARATLVGLDMDPQFNEPYLATSLQDFWGRRWNLMVSNILRLSVYGPIRRVVTPLVGRKGSIVLATVGAFTVSGLMHEVIYFYFTHVRPTWEVTWFFVLHGACTVVEIMVKEAVGQRFRLHRAISGPLTIGFLGVTGWWLFLPQVLRNGVDVKAISEYPIMVRFVRENILFLGSH